MSTTRGVARTPEFSTRLTPAEVRTLASLAAGRTTDEARQELGGISVNTFNDNLRRIGQKQLKPPRASRASKVNTAYELKDLPLPESAAPPRDIEAEDRKLWIAVATHPSIQGIARAVSLSTSAASRRIEELMHRHGALSEPHLVRLGYAYGVLPAATETALPAC
ncbi:hypothetical protein [Streptomyces sp. NBC_00470]|uniref:hypothetical protein n=1 Tax=Streptomyces sp. NBC_00470 TaxID=2975753 RepID=UPI002F91B5FD